MKFVGLSSPGWTMGKATRNSHSMSTRLDESNNTSAKLTDVTIDDRGACRIDKSKGFKFTSSIRHILRERPADERQPGVGDYDVNYFDIANNLKLKRLAKQRIETVEQREDKRVRKFLNDGRVPGVG